jgi:hypothetical protein
MGYGLTVGSQTGDIQTFFMFIKTLGNGVQASAQLGLALDINKQPIGLHVRRVENDAWAEVNEHEVLVCKALMNFVDEALPNTTAGQAMENARFLAPQYFDQLSGDCVSFWRYCNGSTLWDLICNLRAARVAAPPMLTLWFLYQVLSSLQVLYTRIPEGPIIHRDMHTSNILVHWPRNSQAFPDIYIADWGCARIATAEALAAAPDRMHWDMPSVIIMALSLGLPGAYHEEMIKYVNYILYRPDAKERFEYENLLNTAIGDLPRSVREIVEKLFYLEHEHVRRIHRAQRFSCISENIFPDLGNVIRDITTAIEKADAPGQRTCQVLRGLRAAALHTETIPPLMFRSRSDAVREGTRLEPVGPFSIARLVLADGGFKELLYIEDRD